MCFGLLSPKINNHVLPLKICLIVSARVFPLIFYMIFVVSEVGHLTFCALTKVCFEYLTMEFDNFPPSPASLNI